MEANYNTRLNAVIAGLLLMTEQRALNESIREKQGTAITTQDMVDSNHAFDVAQANRKHAEKIRRTKAQLALLNGARIEQDRSQCQDDRDSEPDLPTDDEDPYVEPPRTTKSKKSPPHTPQKKAKGDSEQDHGIDMKKLKKINLFEEKKEENPPSIIIGWISSLFGPANKENPQENPQEKVKKIARLAWHVKKLNPSYRLDDEEESAIACLNAFPDWLDAPPTKDEKETIHDALMKQPIS